MPLLASLLLSILSVINAQHFRHGGLSFTSTEVDLLALYPTAERSLTDKGAKYLCHSARGLFEVEYRGGKVASFMVIDLRPGLDVPARRKQLRQRFSVPMREDNERMIWLFHEIGREAYFKLTPQTAYLVVARVE
jgi:hypothetical protein